MSTQAGNPLARVGPAAGFWLLVFAYSLLVTDAVAKLELGPGARVAALASAAAVVGAILGSGCWSGLSVMKEYATHADSFWEDGARHVELAFGSLAAAVAGRGAARGRLPAVARIALRNAAGPQHHPDDPEHRHVRADDGAARPARGAISASCPSGRPRHRRGAGADRAVPLFASAGRGECGGRPSGDSGERSSRRRAAWA